MDGIRAMQEQLPPGMEVRGVSICPGTDGIRAMQEQLPRTRKLCRGKRDSFLVIDGGTTAGDKTIVGKNI